MRTTLVSSHRQVVRGLLLGVLFVALAKLAGAVKEIVIAARYGVSDVVDAYLFVFNLLNWPIGVWLSVLPTTLLPLLARLQRDSFSKGERFAEELSGVVLLLGGLLAILAWFVVPLVIAGSGLLPHASDLGGRMLSPMVFLLPIGLVSVLLATRLLARGSHVNTLLEGLPALTLVGFLLVTNTTDPEPLVWGTVAGFSVQAVVLLVRTTFADGVPRPRLAITSPVWGDFGRAIAIVAAGQALMSFTVVVDQFMASHLGPGAIAALGYSERVIALLIGLGATAALRATLPVFSSISDDDRLRSFEFAIYWTRILFICGVVAATLAWLAAPWVIRVLFERGAFTAEDSAVVATVFRYGLTQIPFYFGSVVLTALIASHRRYGTIAWIAVGCLIVKIAGNLALAPLLGINGLALSTGLMYAASFAARLRAARPR